MVCGLAVSAVEDFADGYEEYFNLLWSMPVNLTVMEIGRMICEWNFMTQIFTVALHITNTNTRISFSGTQFQASAELLDTPCKQPSILPALFIC